MKPRGFWIVTNGGTPHFPFLAVNYSERVGDTVFGSRWMNAKTLERLRSRLRNEHDAHPPVMLNLEHKRDTLFEVWV